MSSAPRLTLEEARERLFALVEPLAVERVDIAGAVGRYLAEPLVARRTQPAAAMSAMDGYAVLADDRAGPWSIVGESAAGHPFGAEQSAGEAVRISTGALMPSGAAAVIVQEDIRLVDDGRVTLAGTFPSPPDRHVRPRGLDFHEGDALLAAGTRIGAAQAALAVASGHRHLAVRRMPAVAVIDSGDELRARDLACEPHQIPASNGLMLAAMAAGLPARVHALGPIPDNLDSLVAALDEAADADLIVTSGGASVGDHDLIRPALEAWGATLSFWRVTIKPGKPLLVATRERPRGRQIILGLPGNPASAYVTGFLFMLPLLRAMLGAADPLPIGIRMRLGATLAPAGQRREFLRASWDGDTVVPIALQDSGVLTTIARANALIDRPAGAAALNRGDTVACYLLENGGVA